LGYCYVMHLCFTLLQICIKNILSTMEIQEIKQHLSINKVLANYRLIPDRNNRLKCPFHDDKTPSFQVYPKTNTWTCFSSNCKAGSGDQIDFIMKYEGVNKHEAILKAKELISPECVQSNLIPGKELFAKLQESLSKSSKAREYLQQRNLNYNQLEMGYNTGNTYTKLRQCIVFALRDRQHRIVSFYGRSIINNDVAKHYYLANRKGLYPCYPKPETSKLILTEAIIDAATLIQNIELIQTTCQTELVEVLSLYGTNGLTEEHQEAIKELNHLTEIILFFDGDDAGREAIKKHAETLHNLKPGVKITFVETPEGEDINSLSIGHEPEIFSYLLNNRIDFFLSIEKEETQDPNIKMQEKGRSLDTKGSILDTKNTEYITFTTDQLHIVLLGGINLQQLDRLKVTIKIKRKDTNDPLHSIRHSLDLYNSDYVEKFIEKTAEKLELGTTLINRSIAQLIEEIEYYRLSKIESQKEQRPIKKELTEQQKQRAINYLKSPDLIQRTSEDLGNCGIIGEEINRLLMYLVFTSRLREQPLHIISLGATGTGKTYLQEKIAELIPEQDKLEITILSENAFYYFEQTELRNKLVLIEDMDGAEQVLYPLRELQSKKRISKTIPIKDSKGNLKTITLKVEGPICLAGTTTKERLYEDNANRSILIYLDNSTDHEEKIMEYQRRISAGKIDIKRENELKEQFRNMQMVLKPVKVRNPNAEYLKLPEYVFKPLRTNSHYLAFIETITFYHQYQREVKTDLQTGIRYIETTLDDIEYANKLLQDVLLTKSDELPKAIRQFFESLKRWIKSQNTESFYAKDIRDTFRMHPSKLKRYINDLLRYNLVKIVGGSRYKTGYEYEIVKQDDYDDLQSKISTVLESTLQELKNKISGSGGPVVVQKQNRPLNGQKVRDLTAVVQ